MFAHLKWQLETVTSTCMTKVHVSVASKSLYATLKNIYITSEVTCDVSICSLWGESADSKRIFLLVSGSWTDLPMISAPLSETYKVFICWRLLLLILNFCFESMCQLHNMSRYSLVYPLF